MSVRTVDFAGNTSAEASTAYWKVRPRIIDSWQVGTNHPLPPAGTDRALYFALTYNINSTTDLTGLTYGGQAMVQIADLTSGVADNNNVRLEVWRCTEACIAGAADGNFVQTWSAGAPGGNRSYSHVVVEGVDQATMVNDVDQSVSTAASTRTLNINEAAFSISLSSCVHANPGGISWNDITWLHGVNQGSNGHVNRSASRTPAAAGVATVTPSHQNTNDMGCIGVNLNPSP